MKNKCFKTLEESILEVNELRKKSMALKEIKSQRNSGDLYLESKHLSVTFHLLIN